MSYTFKVNITQEIIDRPGVNPNDRSACLCYTALKDAGYDVFAVDMTSVYFYHSPTSISSASLPQEALDYLEPLMDLSNLRQGFYKDKGKWENSWRSVAEPFSYDLELPDEVQPVSKV